MNENGRSHARRPDCGVTNRMRHEAEPEALGERFHLENQESSRAPCRATHHHMGVVNHHALRGAVGVPHRIGEKHLAVEALKGGIDLEKTACANNTAPPRRSAPYTFCRPLPPRAARCRAASPRRARSDIGPKRAQPAFAQIPCLRQNPVCRAPDKSSAAPPAMSSSWTRTFEIPLAGSQKVQDHLPVRFGFLLPLDLRHAGGVRAQHFAHCRARYPQHARDLRVCSLPSRSVPESRSAAAWLSLFRFPVPFRFPSAIRFSSRRALSISRCACSRCAAFISGNASLSLR